MHGVPSAGINPLGHAIAITGSFAIFPGHRSDYILCVVNIEIIIALYERRVSASSDQQFSVVVYLQVALQSRRYTIHH